MRTSLRSPLRSLPTQQRASRHTSRTCSRTWRCVKTTASAHSAGASVLTCQACSRRWQGRWWRSLPQKGRVPTRCRSPVRLRRRVLTLLRHRRYSSERSAGRHLVLAGLILVDLSRQLTSRHVGCSATLAMPLTQCCAGALLKLACMEHTSSAHRRMPILYPHRKRTAAS